MLAFLKKLSNPRVRKRVLVERLSEPMHLNLLSLAVAMVGGYERKIEFDLILRPYHAYAILNAAKRARRMGVPEIHVLEFGVAAGAGLMNMGLIGRKVQRRTGVKVHAVGFDTGEGMPPPVDYRDHPDQYREGDFPMDYQRLRHELPQSASLILGDLNQSVGPFLENVSERCPIGYISVDVDYYSSTVKALRACTGPATKYLPCTHMYFDDITYPEHNRWCGELLGIDEFNAEHARRKIEPERFIRNRRIMKNASWLDQMYILHVLDHPLRCAPASGQKVHTLENPFL